MASVMTSMKLEGMRQVVVELGKRSKNEAAKAIRKGLREGAKLMAQQAKQLAPVKTGALKRSIKVRAGKRKKNLLRMVVLTGSNDNLFSGKQFYGGFVEFGTKRMPARPFLRPAFSQQSSAAEKVIIETIKAELKI